jgi:hypothetical protein
MLKVVERHFCDVTYAATGKLVEADNLAVTLTLDLSQAAYDALKEVLQTSQAIQTALALAPLEPAAEAPTEPADTKPATTDWRALATELTRMRPGEKHSELYYSELRAYADREGIKYDYNGNITYSPKLKALFVTYVKAMAAGAQKASDDK